MDAGQPSRVSGAAEWRGGWRVVLGAMIGIGAGPGLYQNLSSLFTDGLTREFGWSRGDIATAAGIGLIASIAVPFLGRLVDRTGVKPMVVAALLTLGIAYLGFAAMTGPLWQYQLLVVLLALSVPGTTTLCYGKLIAPRFIAHRGLALGLSTSGISISTLVMSPVIAAVILAGGWRRGFVALAIATTVVALPVVLFTLRGISGAPTRRDPDDTTTAPVAGLTGGAARRDWRFWRLGLCAALINIATIGLVTQLVPFGLDRGLTPGEAALLVAAFGASQIVGRLTIGWLVDRYPPRLMAAMFAAISATAFLALQIDAPGFALLVVAVFFAGLMNGAENDVVPFFGVRLFGLRAYGEVYGSILVIALSGTAIGIVGFGRLHDAFGNYDLAIAIGTGALVVAAGLFLTLGDRALPEIAASSAEG